MADNSLQTELSVNGSSPVAGDDDSENKVIEPMEMDQGDAEENAEGSFHDDEEEDMESLLPDGKPKVRRKKSQNDLPPYLQCIPIRPQKVGNMYILFPEQFHGRNNPWGVVGPHPVGPLIVWLLLAVATHYIAIWASRLGVISQLICYLFFGASTFFLTDVSLRDPGICLHTEIPETASSDEAQQWRWCDFCNVFQPPDGAQ